jgi:hypothetical protein
MTKTDNKSHKAKKEGHVCIPHVTCIEAPLFDAVEKNVFGKKRK